MSATWSGLKRPKYRNKPTMRAGRRFASLKEADRFEQLHFLEHKNLIRDLACQVRFKLEAGGTVLCHYVADFTYDEYLKGEWKSVVEDVKGMRTPMYLLKKKMMKAILGIEVRES